ncbi:MAG: alpha-amylase [Lachnospiraceae bacterium]|nr:alpha-amylase [Lachnospiraceae bacterium]
MAWYDEAVFYHIYPLGLTGAPEHNEYRSPDEYGAHRLQTLIPWIDHIRKIGCTALYIGPLFESVGHGYETTDYRKLDSRLGTNEDLKDFVRRCHEAGIRVVLDGVFNHTGRDFFAFKDLQAYRENSRYLHWYCNVNFWNNNEYNDGFSYDNWGGYNLLVKLNTRNPEVRDYLLDTVRFWVAEFDIDGLRLDAADVLDFEFMRCLRDLANTVKPEFWLMGEVIHGEYGRWVNEHTLNSVTNYHLHKALYSGHNDHNYFEIAHTVRRQRDMGLGDSVHLYSFVDNHDVARIMTKLQNKAHYLPVHVLLYTLPGLPSLYYGSEFGIEGKKERGSDASLRPALDLTAMLRSAGIDPSGNAGQYETAAEGDSTAASCLRLITRLGQAHAAFPALSYGAYQELQLTTTKYAFARGDLIVTVNNADHPETFDIQTQSIGDAWRWHSGDDLKQETTEVQKPVYIGLLSGKHVDIYDGWVHLEIGANDGEIWVPVNA